MGGRKLETFKTSVGKTLKGASMFILCHFIQQQGYRYTKADKQCYFALIILNKIMSDISRY